jgi:hypothetical protein
MALGWPLFALSKASRFIPSSLCLFDPGPAGNTRSKRSLHEKERIAFRTLGSAGIVSSSGLALEGRAYTIYYSKDLLCIV